MRRFPLTTCLILMPVAAVIADDPLAAIPLGSAFAYQGQLRQGGLPRSGTCDFEFGLWDDPTASAPANRIGAGQTLLVVPVTNGLFSVELNGAGQFGPSAFDGNARWLSLAVRCPAGNGNYTPLTPRQKVSAVPYALHALNVPTGGDSVWSLNGNSAYYVIGNVGIGTSSPQGPLDVRAGSNSFFRMDSTYGDIHFNGGSDGTFGLFNESGPTGRTAFVANNIERFSVLNNGLVGVGTGNPGMSLEVTTPSYYGKPAIGVSDGAAFAYLHASSSWDHSLVWDSGRAMRFGTEISREFGYAERMRITADGKVGVGTAAPGAMVDAYAQAGAGNGLVAIKGSTEHSFNLFGNFFQGGIGVWGESPSNVGVLGTSTESVGVQGESQNFEGVRGIAHHPDHGAVVGVHDGGGYGMAGFSPNGGFAGVWGNGTRNGVFGSTASGGDSGVFGRNDAGGWGVNGYSAGTLIGQGRFGGTGVEGTSDGVGGSGVIGRGHGLNGVGVHAEAQNGSATALWAYNPSGRGALIDGYTEMNGYLDVNGAAYVNILTIKGGSDLAEPFDVVDRDEGTEEQRHEVEPGMVVVIDPDHPGKLKLSSGSYDRKVAGIISGANGLSPGMVMKASGDAYVDGGHPVALTGRVWCHCDASTNAIEPGDMLTTSDTHGHAMKATDLPKAQGAIIGKAMTALDQGRNGLVLVLVNLQ